MASETARDHVCEVKVRHLNTFLELVGSQEVKVPELIRAHTDGPRNLMPQKAHAVSPQTCYLSLKKSCPALQMNAWPSKGKGFGSEANAQCALFDEPIEQHEIIDDSSGGMTSSHELFVDSSNIGDRASSGKDFEEGAPTMDKKERITVIAAMANGEQRPIIVLRSESSYDNLCMAIAEEFGFPATEIMLLTNQRQILEVENRMEALGIEDGVTLAVLRVLPSEGAKLHEAGACTPCAWFYKKQGCRNGRDCLHCHVCPEGELKRRKKDKVAAIRLGEVAAKGTANRRGRVNLDELD